MNVALNKKIADPAMLLAAQNDNAAVGKVKNGVDLKKTTEAAEDFEAMFVSEMMKPMFEGISTDGMFGGGKGEEIFNGMMIQEYGKLMAKTGTLGLTSQIKDAMIKMQEAADGSTVAENSKTTPTKEEAIQ